MTAGKIKIFKRTYTEHGARREEGQPELYYSPWCDVGSLYGKELYAAIDIRLENTIVFEVRWCKKIKAMRAHLKDYVIEYEGDSYNIFAIDFKRNERQYVQLKAARAD